MQDEEARMALMQDEEARMALRAELEKFGTVEGYHTDGMTIAVMRDRLPDLRAAAIRLGGSVADVSYFPLGSDNPPQEYRHWTHQYCPETGHSTPGFWMFARVKMSAPLNACALFHCNAT